MKKIFKISILSILLAFFIISCQENQETKEPVAKDSVSEAPAINVPPYLLPQEEKPQSEVSTGEGEVIHLEFDIDALIEKHLSAVGQQKLLQVKSMRQRGLLVQQGKENTFVIHFKRPLKYHSEITLDGEKLIQAFDGDKGWSYASWLKDTKTIELKGEQLKQLQEQSSFDDLFHNWEKKFSKLEADGLEKIGDTKYYRIKGTRLVGNIIYIYLDPKTFLTYKTKETIKTPQYEGTAEILFGNYKNINGITLPHKITFKLNNQTMTELRFVSTEFDVDIDDAMFQIPKS